MAAPATHVQEHHLPLLCVELVDQLPPADPFVPDGGSGFMRPEDMVIVDFDGRLLSGEKPPSTEVQMHILIYIRLYKILMRWSYYHS